MVQPYAVRTRSSVLSNIPGVLVAAMSLAIPRAAQGQCNNDAGTMLPPDWGLLRDSFPSANAMDVPIDGFVRLRYVGIVPRRSFVTVREADTNMPVDGRAVVVGDEIHWQSYQELRPNTRYQVFFTDVTGGAGGNAFTFTTGNRRGSSSPPQFFGITGLSVQRAGAADLCGEPDAVEVTVTWRRVADNGWPLTDIEYVVYQTAGPGIGAPVERARERGRLSLGSCGSGSAVEQCTSFRLSAANADGPVCFNVQAFDAYGRSDGNTNERCIDPQSGNTFHGCSVRAMRTETRAWRTAAMVAALAAGVAGWIRRRRVR